MFWAFSKAPPKVEASSPAVGTIERQLDHEDLTSLMDGSFDGFVAEWTVGRGSQVRASRPQEAPLKGTSDP